MDLKTPDAELPENAYRELNPGEVYRPMLSPEYKFPELTTWSVVMGMFLAIVFSAASAYSGLKIGQVMEAAIPISIIAVGLAKALGKRRTIAQNVLIQSIGASSGVVVAGAIFTIPAFFILNIRIDFWTIFLTVAIGACLGISFTIPFRKYFTSDMHGQYSFPEATAITEILVTGEVEKSNNSSILILSALLGGLYDFCINSLGLWREVITSRATAFGTMAAEKYKVVFKFDTLSLIVGLGYIIGMRYSLITALGSMFAWFVLIPFFNQIVMMTEPNSAIALLSSEQIFSQYVRAIGIGAIATAGIIGIIRSSGIIVSSLKIAFNQLGNMQADENQLRTQTDLNFKYVFIAILVVAILFTVFLSVGVQLSIMNAIICTLVAGFIAFLFTTVAANATAMIGTNPVSGMTLMSLITSAILLTWLGITGGAGIMIALFMGTVVCTALAMAGGFITDLKVGYWIGTTPSNQEKLKYASAIISAATVAGVIILLEKVYSFNPANPNYLTAPQANAMASVIEPIFRDASNVKWGFYAIGAMISLILTFLEISPLAFALGMYLPLELNTPLIIGGLLSYFAKNAGKDKALSERRFEKGTLISSGLISGGAIFGVAGAIAKLILDTYNIDIYFGAWQSNPWSEVYGWLAFAIMILLFAFAIWKTKIPQKNQANQE